ncbi:amino-acid N-acetyltransferase [Georgenia yuyongxinii]|uniref:Amino-acid N-acetyltransferase n=1 Tax=Georgenia yuyongxinii TaxID=2589797 RepID=A0A5B8C622_9MICO|nr:amino-acid N-acetyltransferase [Georgenia yuyongxinii]QDC25993.1 amino-acid N-acetyltransferase [Georgenia yuyongxinii]
MTSPEPPAVRAGEPVVRQALPADVRGIYDLVQPFTATRVLIAKELITYFEAVQEFVVAELPEAPGKIVACGALHVLWDDIAEIRTLAVDPVYQGRGLGHRLLDTLIDRARALGLRRLFCLTFEVDFFTGHGFERIAGTPVGMDVYAEMLRSHDDGVAEFLDLARAKPNTLGNTRMLLEL